MEEREVVLLALEITTLLVLALTGIALYKSVSVWRALRGQEGERLAGIVVWVVSVFFVVQLVTVFNVFNIWFGSATGHQYIRLVQQCIVAIGAAWATIRLSQIDR